MREAAGTTATVAQDFWQSFAKIAVSDVDARQMADNLAGFFGILEEWDRKNGEMADATEEKVG